ncbi:MAG: hypothetical protein A2297_07515 [Elusimicrobia bacterium RIFOXYB2_FULL_48_7]|nr:MAG: hypothetical protein A2297_07515 [Elusimicrobia bacterium RIFOXYB2_FULL_48_7]
MLDMNFIEQFYPEQLKPFKRNMLREYLQYKILGYIFDSKYSDKLIFMGGTAARIIYNNSRFSEDLDFDNKGLDKNAFEALAELLKNKLAQENYVAEISIVLKNAFHIYIRFPGIFYKYKLSSNSQEKLSIYLDAEPQNYLYKPDKKVLNKFEVFLRINVVPVEVLLAQKICAVFKRKRPMGRDFYDIVFLSSMVKPSIGYLREKINIGSADILKEKLLDKSNSLNFKQLAKDVEPFLFNPDDSNKVLFFTDYIENTSFKE